jgi:hypothetical protein
VAQTPVTPPAAPVERVTGAPRTPVWRWLLALVATIAVVVVVAGVGYLAVRRVGAPSAVSHYAPANTAFYAEVDLSMPGDQQDQLAQFMSHFPGFADQASFQQKIDDTLNQLLVSSGSGLTWDHDVAPWFGKQVAFFGNPWATSTASSSLDGMSAPPVVVVLSVADRAQLEQVLQQPLNDAGATSADYDGQTLWTIPSSDGALAVTDDALLVGTGADVKTALDVKTGKQASLADDDFYLNQLAALHADRLGTMYVDYGQLLQAVSDSMSSMGALVPGMPSGTQFDQLAQSAGFKLVAEVRADGDHLSFSARSSHPSGDNAAPLPSNRHTALAERMPADSLVYFETRDFGQAIKYMFNSLQSLAPSASGAPDLGLQSITELLGTQPQDFLDFVQDVAVSASYSNDKLGLGLVATVDDENVARSRVTQLLSLVRLAAAGGTSGLTVDDQQHGDVTITMIHLTGTQPSMPGMAGPALPDLSVGVAVANGQLLIGLDDFVANALDRQASDSLAAQPSFKSAAATAGDNAGMAFVDIAGIRSALEQAIPTAGRSDYDQNVKPFLTPFDYLLQYSVTDGDISESHVFLYVK